MLQLTQGQGHKVNGQGQICNFVKPLFWRYIMNQWLDLDVAYTPDEYWWNAEVDCLSPSHWYISHSKRQVVQHRQTARAHDRPERLLWNCDLALAFHFCANQQLLCHAQPHSCASLQLLHKFCSKNRTQLSKLNVAPSLDKRAIVNGGCDLRVWDSGNKGGWLS